MLEAAAQLQVDRQEILLVAYDAPYPEPLGGVRRVVEPFGAALLFTRDRTDRTIAELDVTMDARPQEISRMSDVGLERLRTSNPCAQALPLLAALAGAQQQQVTLERDAGQTLLVCVRIF